MTLTGIILIGIGILILMCVLWVKGIDDMNKNHPDYKGEDYLDEDF
jgi:hypothetical protein